MRIIITGTPGTGKTVLSKSLSKKLGFDLIDIKKIAIESKLLSKTGEVDVRKLSLALSFLKRKDDFVAEGHLACEVKLPSDFIFVLRCEPRVLERRLSRRGYGRKKISENLMSEMLDYCTQRVEMVYKKKPIELDTSLRTVRLSVSEMEKAIKHKKKRIDNIDYSTALKDYLKVR